MKREWPTMDGPADREGVRDRTEGRWTVPRYVSPTVAHTGRKGLTIEYGQAGSGNGGGKNNDDATNPATARA